MNYYAGIGSRETPADVCSFFTKVAAFLETNNYILRSGHAQGADISFEQGAVLGEIYLPWKGFAGSNSKLVVSSQEAFQIASMFHPRWDYLSEPVKKLMARNAHQVLGGDLRSPADFIICWTPGGSGSGGTGQALRMAKHYNIPVFDAGKYNNIDTTRIELKKFLTT